MFKNSLALLVLLALLTSTVFTQTTLTAQTSCIANCLSCPGSPQQCDYIQSIRYPGSNFNCLNYYHGTNCQSFSNGYNIIEQNLDGWRESNQFLQKKCINRGVTFDAFGTQNQDTTIERTITNLFKDTKSVLIELGFFIKTKNENIAAEATPTDTVNTETQIQNVQVNPADLINGDIPQPSSTTTEEDLSQTNNFVDENGIRYQIPSLDLTIFGEGFSKQYALAYQYKEITETQRNSECGRYFKFITEVKVDVAFAQINIRINANKTVDTDWAFASFKLSVGCSGFMIYHPISDNQGTNQGGCNYCQSGYFPVRNSDGSLSQCEICPAQCETCVNNETCIVCNQANIYSKIEKQCSIQEFYSVGNQQQILQGTKYNAPNRGYRQVIITDKNMIRIKNTLKTNQNYTLSFYLLYLPRISNQGTYSFNIDVNNQTVKTLSTNKLTKVSGFYDLAMFDNPDGQKVYADKITVIDLQANQNKDVEVQLSFNNSQLNSYGIANFMVVQEKCPNNCEKCDLNTGNCTECISFFQPEYNCQKCPNGMFLKKYWSQSGTDLSKDQCIKCHSTCFQCVGPKIQQCSQCFPNFQLDEPQYNQQCMKCIFDRYRGSTELELCNKCLNTFNYNQIILNNACAECLASSKNIDDLKQSSSCTVCWISSKLAKSRCVPTSQSGYRFYGADITEGGVIDEESWTNQGLGELKTIQLTSEYSNLYGVENKKDDEIKLKWNIGDLPPHTGLTIFFNIFLTQITQSKKVDVQIFHGNQLNQQSSFQVNTQSGQNIDQTEGKQMIYNYVYRAGQHTAENDISIMIMTKGGGMYIRQTEVYLGNCDQCVTNELTYEIGYIPRYLYERNRPQGLDVWLDFKKDVQIDSKVELQKAFQFRLHANNGSINLQPSEFLNELQHNQRLKYFLPLMKQSSFIDGILDVTTTEDQRIYSRKSKKQQSVSQNIRRMLTRMLLVSRLNTQQSSSNIDRYSSLNNDDSISVNQLFWFFNVFQWLTLIVMIICAFLGIGVIFQDFSIMLQMLFLHVYISSYLLPATFKAPMWGLQRMENLNYFADEHRTAIQSQWFGSDFVYPSPYIFQQFNVDIYFARSFYPTIIINIIYLIWFLLLVVARKFIKSFKNSSAFVITFLRNIPERPINYIDQIWRYQFLTTCWAAFMQFYNLNGRNGQERTNIALCFIAFLISIIWPLFVMFYTYSRTQVSYTTNFLYYYEDIFFKKIETFAESKWKYYLYIIVRSLRVLGVALFIALFTNHELVGPIILIFLNIIEMVYVWRLRIFVNDVIALAFKILENTLFVFIQIALLVVYGSSNTMPERDFLNLGYALIVLYIIMTIIGILRFLYYGYSKFKNYRLNSYGVDAGQKKEYKMTPLPKTDRF